MNLFELFVKVGVDDQASDKVGSLSQKIGNGLKKAAKIGAAAVATVAAAAGAMTAAFVKGTSEVAQYGDNIDKMSQKMGLSAEAYQEWDFIMQHSGTSMESLKASMKTLANAVDTGNKSFKRLGISQKELSKMSQEEIFERTIAELQKVEDTTERTYLASQLLGRGAVELGALLNTSAEDTEAMRKQVHELGGVMSNEAVKAAAAYQDSLQNMQTAFSGIQRGMLSEFLPSLVSVMDGLSLIFSGQEGGIEKISEGVGEFTQKLSQKVPEIIKLATSIISSLADAFVTELPNVIETAIPTVLSAIVNLVSIILDNLPEIIDSILSILPDLIDQFVEALVELTPKLTEAIVEIVQSIADNLPEIIQSILDAIPVITDSVNQAILDNFPALLNAIIQIVLTIVQNLPTIIQTLVDQIGPIVSTIVQVIVENAPAFIAGIVQIVFEIIKALPSILASVAKSVWEIFKGIGTGLVNAWPKFKEGLADLWKKVTEWFDGLWEKTKEFGKNIIDGIKKGIKDAWDNLVKWFKGLFSDLIGIAKKILGIASPSKVFKKIGKWTAEGFGIGFGDEFSNVEDDIHDALDFGDADYGITTSATSISDFGSSSAYGRNGTQSVNVTVGIDDGVNAMGFARALLPFLKVAEKEVYA